MQRDENGSPAWSGLICAPPASINTQSSTPERRGWEDIRGFLSLNRKRTVHFRPANGLPARPAGREAADAGEVFGPA